MADNDPFISGTNPFFRLLDLVNTPQQLTFGAISGAAKGENIIDSAVEGARDNISFSDLLSEMGFEDSVGRKAAGLAGDILLDPLNLLGVGAVRKVVGAGIKGASDVSGLSKVGRAAAKGSPGRTIRELFSPTFGLQGDEFLAAAAGQSAKTGLRTEKGRTVDAISRIVNEGFDPAKEAAIKARGGVTFLDPAGANKSLASFAKIAKNRNASIDEVNRATVELVEKFSLEELSSPELFKSFLSPIVAGENAILDLSNLDRISLSAGIGLGAARKTAGKAAKTYKSFSSGIRRDLLADDTLREYALLFKRTREAKNAIAVSKGLPAVMLQDELLDYMLHNSTREFQNAVMKLPQFGPVREWSAMHVSFLKRELRGLGINDINELGRAGKLPIEGLNGIQFEKVMEDSPFFLEMVRQFRDFKAIKTIDLFDDLATRGIAAGKVGKGGGFAVALDGKKAVPSGWRKIDIMPGATPEIRKGSAAAAKFDNIAWHPDVADHLQAYVDFTYDNFKGTGTVMEKWLEHFDDAQDAWKTITLGIRPAYHSRNFVGNIFNNWLGGLTNPAWYARAVKLQKAGAKGMDEVINIGGRDRKVGELIDLAENMGVVKTGQYLGDVVPRFEKKGFGLTQKLRGERGTIPGVTKVVRTGQEFGGLVEDNARLAHFLWRLDKGDSVTAAVHSVKKHLFDYGELTNFERKVLRRAIPFYSWMKNNSVLQVDSLITKPYKYAQIADVVNVAQSGTREPTLEDKILPEFIKEMSGIRIRRDENGNPEYFLLGAWLPAADLNDVLKPFTGRDVLEKMDPILTRLSPFAQKGIELTTNQSLFFRSEVERFPGEKQKFLGVQMRKRTVNLLKSIILLNEADRIINGGIIPGFSDRAPQSIKANVAQTLAGLKVYDVEEGRALANYFYRRERDISKTKAQLRRARRTGDATDVRTLLAILRDKQRSP